MIGATSARLQSGVLHLSLDLPASAINVLTTAVAVELEAAIRYGLHAGARAIVFKSGKQGSFVNGAQLLHAASLRGERLAQQVRELRAFYDFVADVPVPTVCVI